MKELPSVFFLLLLCHGSAKSRLHSFSRHNVSVGQRIMATTHSPDNACVKQDSIQEFEHYAIEAAMQMTQSRVSLVSMPRLITTLWLARAALSLHAGADFVETGIYRGGTAILAINTLLKYDSCDRHFWGFDSFEGLPAIVDEDRAGKLAVGVKGEFSASEAEFYKNLRHFSADTKPDMLHITKGFFIDTLPKTYLKRIAFLRLDGDIYSSTWDALMYLYPKVIPGGYVYIDDYYSFNGCKKAVDNYRLKYGISEVMVGVSEGERPLGPPARVRRWIAHEASWWQKRW